MVALIKHALFILLNLSQSLATKFMSLSNKPCWIRAFLIDLKYAELNQFPFMFSLDKYSGNG